MFKKIHLFVLLMAVIVATIVIGDSAKAAVGNMLPPFDIGQQWTICQGYNNPSWTHNGGFAYGLDLTGGYCDNSATGRNARAPMNGTIAYYEYPFGNLCINVAGGRSITLTHINASVTSGNVNAGQVVGTVAAAWSKENNGVAHIHLQMWTSPNCYRNAGIPFDSAHGARICGAPDLTAIGPYVDKKGTWAGTTLVGADCTDPGPPPEPDTDTDGIPDSSDWCPQTAGLAINYGCPRPNSQKMVGDFNNDGRSDLAAFFDYGGGNLGLFTWNGQTDGKYGAPDKKWQATSGWEATRVIPAGTGDFDGDTHQDIAAFFNYGNGESRLFVWYGNGNGSFAAASSAWHASSGWDGARITPGGLGDFNNDGRTDITAFFNYGGGQTALFAWNGQANRSFTAPTKHWEALSGWDTRRLSTGVADDFNGDGYQDVAAFFDYGGTSMGVFIWSGSGSGALTIQPRAWFAASGWENRRVIPAGASDFNNDGRSDLAAFFDYGGGNSALFTWSGQADSKFGVADKKWQATSGWDGARITPLGSADFNGDSNPDVTALFDYGGTSTGAFIWSGNGSGSFTLLSRAWFAASGWESSRIIPNR